MSAPIDIAVTVNGDRLLPRKPLRTFEASLETLVADEQGVMRPRQRKTQAGAFAALKGRGGLRAEVLEGGLIRVGDAVEFL